MDISLVATKKILTRFLQRYHVIVFVVIVLGGLAVAVLLLNSTINHSSESDGYVSTTNNTKFDQTTIDRVTQLKSRDQNNGSIDFSHGRTNPFIEK